MNIRSIWFWFRFFFDSILISNGMLLLFYSILYDEKFSLRPIHLLSERWRWWRWWSNKVIKLNHQYFCCSNFFTIIIIIHIENINLGGWVCVCVHVCNDPMILQRIKNEQNSMKWNSKREREHFIFDLLIFVLLAPS